MLNHPLLYQYLFNTHETLCNRLLPLQVFSSYLLPLLNIPTPSFGNEKLMVTKRKRTNLVRHASRPLKQISSPSTRLQRELRLPLDVQLLQLNS